MSHQPDPEMPSSQVATHPAGQLWLRPTANVPSKLAVDRFPYQSQGALNDNKLVLGPAGSGRSIMLARLAEAAHAAGNQVVVLGFDSRGPVAAVGERVGQQVSAISKPADASFNPFWLPALDTSAAQSPTEHQFQMLATLLENMLQLTSATSLPEMGGNKRIRLGMLLRREIGLYYSQQAWLRQPGGKVGRSRNPAQAWHPLEAPSFNSFYEFCLGRWGQSSGMQQADVQQADVEERIFFQWLGNAGAPFYAGGPLDALMNATPEQVSKLVDSPSRLLRVTLDATIADTFKTTVDTPDADTSTWKEPALEAWQRLLLLLLHTFDVHFGSRKQRLTVVIDNLSDRMGGGMLSYLADYFVTWKYYNRDVIIGWETGSPDSTFSPDSRVARLLLAWCDCQVLMHMPSATVYEGVKDCDVLAMSPATQALFLSLRDVKRSVLVRVPATSTGEVFQAWLSDDELEQYRTVREKNYRAQNSINK